MWCTEISLTFFRAAEARFALSAYFLAILGLVVSLSVVALIGFERFV